MLPAVWYEWFDCILPNFAFLLDQTAGLQETKNSTPLFIYPNPFSDKLLVENPASTAAEVRVLNIYGREVLSSIIASGEVGVFKLESLKKGIYTVTISSENKTYSSRVIKN